MYWKWFRNIAVVVTFSAACLALGKEIIARTTSSALGTMEPSSPTVEPRDQVGAEAVPGNDRHSSSDAATIRSGYVPQPALVESTAEELHDARPRSVPPRVKNSPRPVVVARPRKSEPSTQDLEIRRQIETLRDIAARNSSLQ